MRVLWRQSARSSRRGYGLPGRTGRPSAGRRGTGDRAQQPGGMRNAERRNGTGCPPRPWQERPAVRRAQPANVYVNLYPLADGRIYANQGAMTPGASRRPWTACPRTRSNRSSRRCGTSGIASVRPGGCIPKKNGKLRRRADLVGGAVGEVVRLLLEAYDEPTFAAIRTGLAGKGCHTASREVESTWTGTIRSIEGDISDCSDRSTTTQWS